MQGVCYHKRFWLAASLFFSVLLPCFAFRIPEGMNVVQWTSWGPSLPPLENYAAIATGPSGPTLVTREGRLIATLQTPELQAMADALTDVVDVEGSPLGIIALRRNGTVAILGYYTNRFDSDAFINLPFVPTNIVQISAMENFVLMLSANGRVYGAGMQSQSGECVPPVGIRACSAVIAASSYSLALQRDGSMIGWGTDVGGRNFYEIAGTNVVEIAADTAESFARLRDGRILRFGAFNAGIPIPGISNAVAMSGGQSHVLALLADGTVRELTGFDPPPEWLRGAAGVYAFPNGSAAFIPAPIVKDAQGELFHGVHFLEPGQRVEWTASYPRNPSTAFQWKRNGIPIPGATQASLTLELLTQEDSGTYTVVAGDGLESPVINLFIGIANITRQPLGLSLQQDEPLNLSVEAKAAGALTYLWRFNGIPLEKGHPLPPVFPSDLVTTSPELSILQSAPGMAGDYDVVISTPSGSVTSAVARVSVAKKPDLDQSSSGDFAGSVYLRSGNERHEVAQLFTASKEGRLAGIELSGDPGAAAPAFPCWVDVVEVVDGVPGTASLGRGFADYQWFGTHVSFESAEIYLRSGSTYAFILRTDSPLTQALSHSFRTVASTAYPGGRLLRRDQGAINWVTTSDQVLWFQTRVWPPTSALRLAGLPPSRRVDLSTPLRLQAVPFTALDAVSSVTLWVGNTSLGDRTSAPYLWDWLASEVGKVPVRAVTTLASGTTLNVDLGDISVLAPRPPNDDFANRTSLPAGSRTASAPYQLQGATSELGEAATGEEGTGRTVWFAWTAASSGDTALRSTGPANLAVWTGWEIGTLHQEASGRDRCHIAAVSNAVYWISVEAVGEGEPLNGTLALSQNNVELTSPANGAVYVGQTNVSLKTKLTDTGRILTGVQLLTNGVVAKTWPTPTAVDAVTLTGSGVYRLALQSTDSLGLTTESAARTVTVRPKNDSFTSAITLSGINVLTETSNGGATAENLEPHYGDNQGGHSIWYRWTAPVDGVCVLRTRRADFSLMLGVYTGTRVSKLVPVASNALSLAGTPVSFMATAGTTYYIMVDGLFSEQGPLTWSLEIASSNDHISFRRHIGSMPYTELVNLQGASMEPGEEVIGPGGAVGSLWWWWRAEQSALLKVRATSTSTPVVLAIYRGKRPVWFEPLTDSGAFGTQAEVALQVTAGERVEIALFSAQPNTGDVQLTMSLDSLNLISPASGAILRTGASIPLESRVENLTEEGVQVVYRANGTEIARGTSPTFRAIWHPPGAGFYRLTAETTQEGARLLSSLPVNIRVQDNAEIPLPKFLGTPTGPTWFARDALGSLWAMTATPGWFDLVAPLPEPGVPALLGKSPSGADWVDAAGYGYVSDYIYLPETQVWALDATGHLYLNGQTEIPAIQGSSGWKKVFPGIGAPAAQADNGKVVDLESGRVLESPPGEAWFEVSLAMGGGYGLNKDGVAFGLPGLVPIPNAPGVSRWKKLLPGFPGAYLVGDDENIYTVMLSSQEGPAVYPNRPIVKPSGVTRWVEYHSGQDHMVALGDDGQLYTTGSNANGQLGVGPAVASTNQFSKVALPPGVTRWITCGAAQYQTIALGDDCAVYVCGINSLKGLGISSVGAVYNMARVPELSSLCGEPVVFLEGPGSVQPDGGLKLEFPTLRNRRYRIQYTDDLAAWRNVEPVVLGTGAVVTWVDHGPPGTDSAPSSASVRLYRIIFAP